jgi:hypothetical protein
MSTVTKMETMRNFEDYILRQKLYLNIDILPRKQQEIATIVVIVRGDP